MSKRILAMVLSSVWLLSGCVTSASMYADPIAEFDKAFKSTQDLVSQQAGIMDQVKRRKNIEALFYSKQFVPPNADDPKLKAFVSIVCASSDYLRTEKAALGELGKYDEMLDSVDKAPKQDLIDIAASIRANWDAAESLTATVVKPTSTLDCTSEVNNLILVKPALIPEFAPLALYAAVSALWDAAKSATLTIGGKADDVIRGEKLKKYVLASNTEVQKALSQLNEIDTTIPTLCSQLTLPNQSPCKPIKGGSQPSYTRLEGATIAAKWAALRKPWHLYLSMYETEAALKRKYLRDDPAAKTSDPTATATYIAILDHQQDDLGVALADYQKLASVPGPGSAAKGLTDAQKALLDLANGKISAEQAVAAIKDLNTEIDTIKKSLSSVGSTWSKLETTVKSQ
jgi:hypothetical protein